MVSASYFYDDFIDKVRYFSQNGNDVFEALKLLRVRKIELILDNENIKYEPMNIKISRDIIEKAKSQPELKDFLQEIESIYSSTLTKHQEKQPKVKL